MSLQHLILDFDGTLVDSGPAILVSLGAAFAAQGIEPVRPLTRDVIGPPLHATLRTLSGSDDRELIDKLAAEFRARYDTEGLYATTAYPGIAELLRTHVNAGRRLYLATNKRQRPTLLLLDHFGWRQWFTAIYCIDSRTPPYPSKGEMLRVLVREQGLDTAACVYVGDTCHDEAAAAEAGLGFVAVGWGYGVGEQAVSAGVRVLSAPGELLDLP